MKLYGLTGGIGMGKSTAAALLHRRGIPVVDTDTLARELVEPGQPALGEIRDCFGPGLLDSAGRLRRRELGQVVFGDEAARRKLEAILHPRIRQRWQAQVAAWRAEGRAGAAVVIPLLFETGAAGEFTITLCAACSPATQRERLRARGWDDSEIDRRNQSQWPVPRKIELADRVVWTEGDLGVHERQLNRIVT